MLNQPKLIIPSVLVATVVVVYLLAAYIGSDFNPASWPAFGRFCHVGFSLAALVLAGSILGDIYWSRDV